MTLDFIGKTLDYYEHAFLNNPYIGYISPNGQLINYNFQSGNLHSDFGTLISWTFLLWIKQNNLLNNTTKINTFLNTNTGEIENVIIPTTENERIMQIDLLLFLKQALTDNIFIQNIKSKTKKNRIPQDKEIITIEDYFGKYNIKQLLLFLKDICIQYLGYDSIERLNPNQRISSSPSYYHYDDIKKLDYIQKPRIITTSSHNVNERFYNFILMDWIIQRLPKYIYNEQTKSFEIEPSYITLYESDTEQTLAEEIKSIKRLIPINERTKYFRQ